MLDQGRFTFQALKALKASLVDNYLVFEFDGCEEADDDGEVVELQSRSYEHSYLDRSKKDTTSPI